MARFSGPWTAALVGLASLVTTTVACKADNCARAVTGTATLPGKPDITSRREDCSNAFRVTETPVPVTEWVTQTITVTVTEGQGRRRAVLERRTAVQTIPTYATACPDLTAYSSACSCWGVEHATTTLPPVTVTSTTAITVTTAVPPLEPPTCTDPSACVGFKACQGFKSTCLCERTAEGQTLCLDAHSIGITCPEFQSCTASSDCPLDNVCVTSNCCVLGVCVPRRSCLNALSTRHIFRIRGSRALGSPGVDVGVKLHRDL